MTLKIEKICDRQTIMLRLIGRIRSEHLDHLKSLMEEDGPGVMLNLDEVTLVDVEVVRFLRACEENGVKLLNCSSYIREWIHCEQDKEGKE